MGVPEKPTLLFVEGVLKAFQDDLRRLHPDVSREVDRDFLFLFNRLKHEGISYFTKVLPKLGKDLLSVLDSGSTRLSGCPPKFLRWAYTGQEGVGGVISAIQLTHLFSKMEADAGTASADLVDFVARTREDPAISVPEGTAGILHCLFPQVETFRFRHGPGAVNASGTGFKHSMLYPCWQSESVFPFKETVGFHGDVYDVSMIARFRKYYTSRVISVPKTSTRTRIIAIEDPLAMFIQQGIMHYMYGRLKSIGQNLYDQSRMHRSIQNGAASIDLSAASDSVRLSHLSLFPAWLVERLMAVRSMEYCVAGEPVLAGTTFATMGNATTFPVMTALLVAILHARGLNPAVYGDDITVAPDHYSMAVETLGEAGFLVNQAKSFSGRLRESCGLWLYDQLDVTPFFVRSGPDDIHGTLACAREASQRFYLSLSDFLYKEVEFNVGRLPLSNEDVGYLYRHSPRLKQLYDPSLGFSQVGLKQRFIPRLGGWCAKVPVLESKHTNNLTPGERELPEWLLTASVSARLKGRSQRLARRWSLLG